MIIDAHIHLDLDGADWKAARVRHEAAPDEAWVRATLEQYAQAGFSYLRDGGDKWGASLLAARLAPEYGIEFASPAWPLYPQGQYGSFIGKPFADYDDFRRRVDEAASAGASFVKLMLSGMVDFDCYGAITSPGLPGEDVFRLVAYTHQQGLPVMAHVNTSCLVADALDAGVDSVEHGLLIDAATCEKIANSQTIWVPTATPVREAAGSESRVFREHIAAISAVVAQGGLVALGSDAGSGGVPHVWGGQQERRLLGVPEADLSRAAEVLVARFPA